MKTDRKKVEPVSPLAGLPVEPVRPDAVGLNRLTDLPAWVNDYIGIPFEACNCWQLMCLIYRDQLNIKLPYLDNRYADAWDQVKISEIYAAELARVWQPTEQPAVFSAVVFNIQGNPWHVGCVVAEDTMLHTHYRINAAVERFNNAIWRHRIEGFYNYVGK